MLTTVPGPPDGVWRPLLFSRLFMVALGLVWFGLASTVFTHPTGLRAGFDLELVLIVVVMLVIGAGCISIAFSYIAVEPEHLVLRNFLPRPQRIPYATVRSVAVGSQGLEVRIRGRRRPIYGWAVQGANWRAVTGRPGRTELLLRQIREHAPGVHVPDA